MKSLKQGAETPTPTNRAIIKKKKKKKSVQVVRGVTVVPNLGDQEFYAKTLVEDFAGALLSAFSMMVGS